MLWGDFTVHSSPTTLHQCHPNNFFVNNSVVRHQLNVIGKILLYKLKKPHYKLALNFSLYWLEVFNTKPFLSCILLGLCLSAPLLVLSYFYVNLNAPIFPPRYNEETDQILHYERVSLIDLEKIEMGPYTWWVPAVLLITYHKFIMLNINKGRN